MTSIIGAPPPAGKRRPASVQQIDYVFREPELSDGAKLLAVVILNYQALELGACVLSRGDLGARTGKARASVQRHLAELRALGWLVETPRAGLAPMRRIVLRPRLVGRRNEPGGGQN